MGESRAYVEKAVTAENMFTDAIRLEGNFMVEIRGTFTANVVVQRRRDSADTWQDVTKDDAGTIRLLTGAGQWNCFEGAEGGAEYRAGVKTGGFTSGTATTRITQ